MLRFIDLFAGIGGFRMGMEQAGHRCAGYVEIDKYARRSYEAVYDTEGEWSAADIRCVSAGELRAIGRIDCFCGGFPCQTFSIAGRRSGFEDTRGTLFFEIARLAQSIRPPLLFLENVKGLLSHGGGGRLKQSSLRWMIWGMMWNGRCLTARISECPKTENVCTLLDILEENAADKYSLSEKSRARLRLFQ